MTPKRTAPPVARMLAEKPAAPFPDPEEGEEDGELALLLAEDRTEEAPEDLAGVVVVLLGLPEAGRSQHLKSNKANKWRTAATAKLGLESLGLRLVSGSTVRREAASDGLLVLSVGADARGVSAGEEGRSR